MNPFIPVTVVVKRGAFQHPLGVSLDRCNAFLFCERLLAEDVIHSAHLLCSKVDPTSGKLPFTVKAVFHYPHTLSQPEVTSSSAWQVNLGPQVTGWLLRLPLYQQHIVS